MKSCCIVVVGHVDHGKTALVHALTGMETDRLPEEKARGLSITAGFAHATFPEGSIDFIDAPGHEDFVQAMVSAATGARAALVVISATEGIAAQTREHLEILRLLGITEGVVAVTKSDLPGVADHEARLEEVRRELSRTSMASAPLVLCSARTGAGITVLRDHLREVFHAASAPASPRAAFLPIDRVFSLAGHGTVITGTLSGGEITPESDLMLAPPGRVVRLRSLQSRGTDCKSVSPGARVAANLRGVSVEDVERGAVLVAKDAGAPSACFDVRIEMSAEIAKGLRHMEEVRVLFGTAHEVASVRVYGGGGLDPSQSGYAQLRFRKPVFGFEGQRAILRRLSPPQTIGGAEILDAQAPQARTGDRARLRVLEAIQRRAPANIAVALATAQGNVARLSEIARLSRGNGELGEGFLVLAPDLVASTDAINTVKASLLAVLTDYHAKHPLRMTAPRTAITLPRISPLLMDFAEAELSADGQILRSENTLALSSHDPLANLTASQNMALHEIDGNFRAAGLDATSQMDVEPELVTLLIDIGRVLRLRNIALNQTLLFHSEAVIAVATQLCASFTVGFTTSQARTALGTSRKIIVPILEHFDTCGVTLREGDTRRMTGTIPVPPPALPR